MDNEERASLLLAHNRSRKRSCCATSCSTFSLLTNFIILLLTAFYLGYFIRLDLRVDKLETEPYSEGQCILFGRSSQSDSEFSLDNNVSCEIAIYGSAAVVLFEVILLVLTVCNSIWGRWLVHECVTEKVS